MTTTDTIAAIATAAGSAGVGIVRLSGPAAHAIAKGICGRPLPVRRVAHVRFHADDGSVLDDGIALRFVAPRSFTGEDVVELQAHGSMAVLHELVARACGLGARMARAGEFSERAYLNGKLDLVQAEATADLIAASDLRAARAARRALDGVFSERVNQLAQTLLEIRVHVEAAIDFADEPLDTLGGAALRGRLHQAISTLTELLQDAQSGQRLRDGLHAVIVGPPNAGKSSLLNALAGSERAIVTEIAGTTRDVLRETVRINGIELVLVDTAGLRDAGDAIEREGMRRARAELAHADLALVVVDARDPDTGLAAISDAIAGVPHTLHACNKADLLPEPARDEPAQCGLLVSARTGEGLEQLRDQFARLAQQHIGAGGGAFTARARHVLALQRVAEELAAATGHLDQDVLELAAEALRNAHDGLGEITGRVLPDALLGHIFSSFCIGK